MQQKKSAIVTGASSGIGFSIAKELCNLGYEVYGFGRNFSKAEVASYIEEGLIQIAQLHGAETEEDIRKLRMLEPKAEIWKAFKIRDTKTLAKAQNSGADRILLDNGYGTGSCFDWQLLKEQVPARPYLLAGGLRAENIEEALERFVPWGVDVSSGVETEKEKDFGKIRDIIEIIRSR